MADNTNLNYVEGKAKEGKTSEKEHEIKISANRLVREAGNAGIPIFVAYYSETEGYVFNGMLPEELGVESQYGKFNEFMRTCIGFNKDEAFNPKHIKTCE